MSSEPTSYPLKLASRAEIATGTLEFRFERPAGFQFKAGQSMDLTLIDPPEMDAEGPTRAFSINSAPDDAQLIFTTRLRPSAFKRLLQSVPLGSEFKGEGPFGDFTLPNKATRPIVLLAGGIGVTPFRSMVRRAAHERLPHRILLVVANRRPEDAPFGEEFEGLARENPNFTFVPTMTRVADSAREWNGTQGHIDRALIQRHLQQAAGGQELAALDAVYFIAGPPKMVAALRTMLGQAGIDDDDIRTEEFAGY
jgi:ferredoxin-NADP reductase